MKFLCTLPPQEQIGGHRNESRTNSNNTNPLCQ